MATDLPTAMRPARDLLRQLPLLSVRPDQRIDYAAADAALLLHIADNADMLIGTINQGLSAMGTLLAHASPEVGSSIAGDTVESLGWFMAEVADVSATLLSLVAACRQHTVDYTPPQSRKAPAAMAPVSTF